MTTRVSTFPLRLPVSMKAALEKISERDGTSLNQFLVIAAAEKIAAMETERFFAERKNRADRKAFRRILNRKGGKPPVPTTPSARTAARNACSRRQNHDCRRGNSKRDRRCKRDNGVLTQTLQPLFAPVNYIILYLRAQFYKIGAEPSYPDHKVPVVLRVRFGVEQFCRIHQVVLDVLAALFHERFSK